MKKSKIVRVTIFTKELYGLSFQKKVKVFMANSRPDISRFLLKSVNEALIPGLIRSYLEPTVASGESGVSTAQFRCPKAE